MALVGGRLAAAILNRFKWHDVEAPAGYEGSGKIEALFGAGIWDQIAGKTVLDFGCGPGLEAIEVARHGAKEVIGLDIQEKHLVTARARQAAAGVSNCTFVQRFDSQADVILSIDSFEHFRYPDAVLKEMSRLLRREGKVIVSFGPPWYHPRGGHFPLFVWAHLLLTENSLMKWRSIYKHDGAKRFHEVAGGLNQMSIRKFERLVAESPLQFETFETVPIRAARAFHFRLTREFFSSIVRSTLVHRS
ncbi:MAG TPA: class I SAM-dependent methyltransferase [Bryobacteraceae bacterium]|nr:class I SAM-dependent methyltransferase [Bryobacteraceae bacterium]